MIYRTLFFIAAAISLGLLAAVIYLYKKLMTNIDDQIETYKVIKFQKDLKIHELKSHIGLTKADPILNNTELINELCKNYMKELPNYMTIERYTLDGGYSWEYEATLLIADPEYQFTPDCLIPEGGVILVNERGEING